MSDKQDKPKFPLPHCMKLGDHEPLQFYNDWSKPYPALRCAQCGKVMGLKKAHSHSCEENT